MTRCQNSKWLGGQMMRLCEYALGQRSGSTLWCRTTPDIARQSGLQRHVIRRLQGRSVDLCPAVKRLPHGTYSLADGEITHADLSQVVVHVAEHGIEHCLCQIWPRRASVYMDTFRAVA